MNTKSYKKLLLSEDEMFVLAAQVAKAVEESAIIFLNGPLGAGKTTFTRGFLRALGYDAKVKSPTYTLVEPYEIAGKKIFHFDLYRLTDVNELEQIGIRDYFAKPAICLIEWPEHGFPLLPVADLTCHIAFSDKGREITIESLSAKGDVILRKIS
jgi:tRNA threonylcarbamoyladenosine biosynthesis protein TsaE